MRGSNFYLLIATTCLLCHNSIDASEFATNHDIQAILDCENMLKKVNHCNKTIRACKKNFIKSFKALNSVAPKLKRLTGKDMLGIINTYSRYEIAQCNDALKNAEKQKNFYTTIYLLNKIQVLKTEKYKRSLLNSINKYQQLIEEHLKTKKSKIKSGFWDEFKKRYRQATANKLTFDEWPIGLYNEPLSKNLTQEELKNRYMLDKNNMIYETKDESSSSDDDSVKDAKSANPSSVSKLSITQKIQKNFHENNKNKTKSSVVCNKLRPIGILKQNNKIEDIEDIKNQSAQNMILNAEEVSNSLDRTLMQDVTSKNTNSRFKTLKLSITQELQTKLSKANKVANKAKVPSVYQKHRCIYIPEDYRSLVCKFRARLSELEKLNTSIDNQNIGNLQNLANLGLYVTPKDLQRVISNLSNYNPLLAGRNKNTKFVTDAPRLDYNKLQYQHKNANALPSLLFYLMHKNTFLCLQTYRQKLLTECSSYIEKIRKTPPSIIKNPVINLLKGRYEKAKRVPLLLRDIVYKVDEIKKQLRNIMSKEARSNLINAIKASRTLALLMKYNGPKISLKSIAKTDINTYSTAKKSSNNVDNSSSNGSTASDSVKKSIKSQLYNTKIITMKNHEDLTKAYFFDEVIVKKCSLFFGGSA